MQNLHIRIIIHDVLTTFPLNYKLEFFHQVFSLLFWLLEGHYYWRRYVGYVPCYGLLKSRNAQKAHRKIFKMVNDWFDIKLGQCQNSWAITIVSEKANSRRFWVIRKSWGTGITKINDTHCNNIPNTACRFNFWFLYLFVYKIVFYNLFKLSFSSVFFLTSSNLPRSSKNIPLWVDNVS